MAVVPLRRLACSTFKENRRNPTLRTSHCQVCPFSDSLMHVLPNGMQELQRIGRPERPPHLLSDSFGLEMA
jgi:hypothetical protein